MPAAISTCRSIGAAWKALSAISLRGKRLVEVNLMCAEITALLKSTFTQCVAITHIWLPPRLTQIGKEVFLNCIALRKVVIPTELHDTGIRAFCGCEQSRCFTPLDWGKIDRIAQAEHSAFLMRDNFEKPPWVELLPTEGPDRTPSTRSFIVKSVGSTPVQCVDHLVPLCSGTFSFSVLGVGAE